MALSNDAKRHALQKFDQALLERAGEFQKLLPKGWSLDRFAAQARVAVAKTPKLLEVQPASVIMALYQCAELGLVPGGGLGHGWIVPYGQSAQWVTGYKGLIYLAVKARAVVSVRPVPVFVHEVEAGKFKHREGSARALEHDVVPLADDAPDPVLHAAYVSMLLADGQRDFHIMYRRDVLKRRNRSAGYKSAIQYGKDHPWISEFVPMALKTAIRDALKSVPTASEAEWGDRLARAFEVEDAEFEVITGPDEDEPAAPPKGGMEGLKKSLQAQGNAQTLEQAMGAPTQRQAVPVGREPGDDAEYTPEEPPAGVQLPRGP